MRKIITILTTAALICNLPMPALPAQAAARSGKCGDNITYTFADGVLTLTGTGATDDYDLIYDMDAFQRIIEEHDSQNSPDPDAPDDGAETEEPPQDTEPDPDDLYPEPFEPDLRDYCYTSAPWGTWASEIKTVQIGAGITKLGKFSFAATAMETLELPETLTVIGDYAFQAADLPASVRLPDSVTEIGENAFNDCKALAELQFPASLQKIGKFAFSGCDALSEAALPDSVTEIGSSAFAFCKGLRTVHIPAKLQAIPSSMFSNTALTTLLIPENITEIGHHAFCNSKIEQITVPDSVQTLGTHCFTSCQKLTEVTLPDHLTELPADCFSYCYALREIRIPSACKTIGGGCFTCCSVLDSVTLPEGLKTIGALAFSACPALTSAVLPDSIETLGEGAFAVSGLKEINFPPLLTALPDECYGSTKLEAVTIPERIREVGESCFQNCKSLKSIVFPDTDIRLGAGCLGSCESLTEVHLPAHCKEIPFSMFAHCSALETLAIPDTCEKIGNYSFMNCSALKALKIPDGVPAIEEYTFKSCTSLQKIAIPPSVKQISSQAFAKCEKLTEVSFSEGLETIDAKAFDGAPLHEVILPDSIKELGRMCFYTCDTEVFKLPAHTVRISSNALPKAWVEKQKSFVLICDNQLYQYRGSDTEVIVPEGVKSIMQNAFSDDAGCKAVSIKLSSTVESIEQGAFSCQTLETLEIPENVTDISTDALRSCPNLKLIRGELYSSANALAKYAKVEFEAQNPEDLGEAVYPQTDTETFSFGNFGEVFGSSYHVTPWNQAMLCDHTSSPSHIQEAVQSGWRGSCFGLSAVTVLVKSGILPLSVLDPNAKTLHDVKPTAQALDVINFYQLAQSKNSDSRNDLRAVQLQQLLHAANCANKVNHGGSPFLLSLTTATGGHAVVGYGLEAGEWTWDDAVYDRRILIWDSNYVEQNDEAMLYFNKDTLHWTIPAYNIRFTQDFTSDVGMIADIIPHPEQLNRLPFQGDQPLSGDADRNNQVTVADAVLLARYVAEDAALSYTGELNADTNADSIIDMTDVFAVLRSITYAK